MTQPLYYTLTERVNSPGTIVHNAILMRKIFFYKTSDANAYGSKRIKETDVYLQLVKFERDN
jgi:hypothetical protein